MSDTCSCEPLVFLFLFFFISIVEQDFMFFFISIVEQDKIKCYNKINDVSCSLCHLERKLMGDTVDKC